MIPVRRVCRSKRRSRVIEHGDEHRRHAVQAGASLGLDRFHVATGSNPSEGLTIAVPWLTQARLPRPSKAVIVGHRDAKPVLGRQPHRFADEVAVIDDVVVREGRALRSAGGAGGELDVDRIVELQLCAEGGERLALLVRRGFATSSKLSMSGVVSAPSRMTISSFGSRFEARPGSAASISGALDARRRNSHCLCGRGSA